MIESLPDRPLTDAEVQALDQQFEIVTKTARIGDDPRVALLLIGLDDGRNVAVGFQPDWEADQPESGTWTKIETFVDEPAKEVVRVKSEFYAANLLPPNPVPRAFVQRKQKMHELDKYEGANPLYPIVEAEKPCIRDCGKSHPYVYQMMLQGALIPSILTYNGQTGGYEVTAIPDEISGIAGDRFYDWFDECIEKNPDVDDQHGFHFFGEATDAPAIPEAFDDAVEAVMDP